MTQNIKLIKIIIFVPVTFSQCVCKEMQDRIIITLYYVIHKLSQVMGTSNEGTSRPIFLDRSRYFSFSVPPQLYSRG
jgi:hypothetical protein